MLSIAVRFIFYSTKDGSRVPERTDTLRLDESATYEEIIDLLTQRGFLLPLDSPLRYNLVFGAYDGMAWHYSFYHPVPHPTANLREGHTLTSTHLINKEIYYYECDVTIVIAPPPSTAENANGIAPTWSEAINAVVTSSEANIINVTASIVTITTALIVIAKWWSKKDTARNTSLHPRTSQASESDILAIRLQMTDGTEATFQEWLADPSRLKHYIDVFHQQSASTKPLEVVFVLKHGLVIVDVSEGTQNNLQLNELLGYMNIDSAQK